jgi:hypothetical protein
MKGRKGCMKSGGAAKGVMPKTTARSSGSSKRLAPLDGEVAKRRVDKILRAGSGKPSNVAGNAYKASEGPGTKPKR